MQKAIKRYFPVFVLPTLIAFTIGFLAPFVLGVYLSFCKFTTVTDARFIGLGIKNTVRKILVPLIFFVKSIATAKAKMLISNTVTIVNNAVNQRE